MVGVCAWDNATRGIAARDARPWHIMGRNFHGSDTRRFAAANLYINTLAIDSNGKLIAYALSITLDNTRHLLASVASEPSLGFSDLP